MTAPQMSPNEQAYTARQEAVASMVAQTEARDAAAATPAPEVEVEHPEEPDVEQPDADETADDSTDDESDSADDTDADETDDSGKEPEDAEFDDAFDKALKASGKDLSLESIPKEHRGPVEKLMKELRAGFTQLRQRDTARFADYEDVKVQATFLQDNFFDIAVAELAKDPQRFDAVVAAVAELQGHPRGVTYAERDLTLARDAVAKSLQEEAEKSTKNEQRTERLTRDARAAADALGVPYTRGMAQLLDHAMQANPELTRREVIALVKEEGLPIKALLRQQKRDASKTSVHEKIKNATSGPRIKPGSGRAPAPSAAKPPGSRRELVDQLAADAEARRAS